MKKSEVSIYDFVNYKTFLKTIFEDLKFHNRGVSYKTIQERAGYSGGSNHLWQIIEGKTPISDSAIVNYGKALLLTNRELKYFKLMVDFEDAKTDEQREKVIKQMRQSKLFSRAQRNYLQVYEIYSDWYLPILWEMVSLDDFQEDTEWIAKRLFHDVSISKIRKGIEKLLEAEALYRDDAGKLHQAETLFPNYDDTKKDAGSLAFLAQRRYVREMLKLSAGALEKQPFDSRIFYTGSLVFSKEEYDTFRKKIIAFIKDMYKKDPSHTKKEVIYQINLQFFSNTSLND